MLERELKRYAAYFRGWCQPFGEHESLGSEASGISWLFAQGQLGLVLPKTMIRPLYREVLLRDRVPVLTFDGRGLTMGSLLLPVGHDHGRQAVDALRAMLVDSGECHLFLTSHLLYSGSRIITFSSRKPIAIIYKEIGRMQVRLPD